MNQIELPIFHHSETSETLKNCGVNYLLEQCEVRPVTFFTMNAISPYYENREEYSCIHSNGSEYICSLKKAKVLEIINKKN
jgi:hypothetical protein